MTGNPFRPGDYVIFARPKDGEQVVVKVARTSSRNGTPGAIVMGAHWVPVRLLRHAIPGETICELDGKSCAALCGRVHAGPVQLPRIHEWLALPLLRSVSIDPPPVEPIPPRRLPYGVELRQAGVSWGTCWACLLYADLIVYARGIALWGTCHAHLREGLNLLEPREIAA